MYSSFWLPLAAKVIIFFQTTANYGGKSAELTEFLTLIGGKGVLRIQPATGSSLVAIVSLSKTNQCDDRFRNDATFIDFFLQISALLNNNLEKHVIIL